MIVDYAHTVFPSIKSADIRKFDIFRWGHYLKNFKFYVLNVLLFCEKGGTLFKGGHYLRKYGMLFLKMISFKIHIF